MISPQVQRQADEADRLIAETRRLNRQPRRRPVNMATTSAPSYVMSPESVACLARASASAEQVYANALTAVPVPEALAAWRAATAGKFDSRTYAAATAEATDLARAEWTDGKAKGDWQTRDLFVAHRVNEMMGTNKGKR